MKRGLDVLLVLVFSPLWLPLACLAACAAVAGQGFPVLFRQERAGLGGRPFRMFKLRTMRPGDEPDAERLTRVGRILRQTSLDELPELLNVLRGEMSLVGPRPLPVRYLPRYTREQSRRHEVRPGVTGWAQIHGRNALDWEAKFRYDVEYVERRSLALDAKILFLTVFQVLFPRHVAHDGEATMSEFMGTAATRPVRLAATLALLVGLIGAEVRAEDVFAWRGEATVVWRDITNTTASAQLVRPTTSAPFVRAGLALPVLGDANRLYPDRVVWGGSQFLRPGETARLVAEVTAPRTGDVPHSASVACAVGSLDITLHVAPRVFPKGRDRRTFLDLWQHPWAVARLYGVKPFSPRHYERMRPLWTQLADAGQKVVTATIMNRPWAHQCFDAYGSMVRHIRRADGGWRFDYGVFDEYVAFALDCGLGPQIHCYTLCPFRLKRYYWQTEAGQEAFGDFDVGSKEFEDYWAAFLDDFARHLREKGWFDQTYIALDERSPAELKAACDLVRRHGRFKIAMAGDRPPSQFDGLEVDNFSIALQCVTPKYIAETRERRAAGRTTSVYCAGGNPCTGLAQPPIDCMWLGTYPGAVDLDGFLRWAYCSWPANPASDATYAPWFGFWSAGGTFLVYPESPSLRFLALRNGLNLTEKLHILRTEGRLDAATRAILAEFAYKGAKNYPKPARTAALLSRTARAIDACSQAR